MIELGGAKLVISTKECTVGQYENTNVFGTETYILAYFRLYNLYQILMIMVWSCVLRLAH